MATTFTTCERCGRGMPLSQALFAQVSWSLRVPLVGTERTKNVLLCPECAAIVLDGGYPFWLPYEEEEQTA